MKKNANLKRALLILSLCYVVFIIPMLVIKWFPEVVVARCFISVWYWLTYIINFFIYIFFWNQLQLATVLMFKDLKQTLFGVKSDNPDIIEQTESIELEHLNIFE